MARAGEPFIWRNRPATSPSSISSRRVCTTKVTSCRTPRPA